MIPTIQRDRIAFVGGTLHTHFQRTGLSRTARLSAVPVASTATFSVTAKENGFALSGPGGEIESFRLEKEALSGLNQVARVLAADPNGRWQAHRRYTMLAAGAFLALSAGAGWLNSSAPAHDHDHAAPAAQVASANAGYAAAMASPPQVSAPLAPIDPAANSNPPTKRAIHFGKRDTSPEKTLYVFSDPQCPHCRELEKTLAALPADYGVYVFSTPFLPGADELAAKIHCASDPKKAWRDAMAGKTVAGSGICDKASWGKENTAFFRSVGLTATPTIVAGIDGRIRTGATDLPTLLAWMKAR
jgi:protein-disulfide isomerase